MRAWPVKYPVNRREGYPTNPSATCIYEASGGDLILTRELLGHASVQTTQVYAHANRAKMQRVVERL